MPASDTAQGTWVDRNGGFAGHGEPSTTTTLTVDGTAYAITCDPTMAALKAIRELAGHARPRRGCQEGICGKCESMVDGTETRLCITPIGTLAGANVVTPTCGGGASGAEPSPYRPVSHLRAADGAQM